MNITNATFLSGFEPLAAAIGGDVGAWNRLGAKITDQYIPGAVSPNEMPPHSIEVFVNAPNETSTNNAIAQAIYDAKPVGIQVVSTDNGARTGLYTDVNGLEGQIMPISSTVDVPIYIIVERTKTAAYPTGGDDQIKVNLVNYFYSLTLGDDVYEHRLSCR